MKFETKLGLSVGGVYASGLLMCISFFNGLDILGALFGLCIPCFLVALLVVGIRDANGGISE